MAELFSTFGVGTVLIILLIGIPAIVNFIKWCKGLWNTREKFKQENIEKGKAIEARAEEREARLARGEARMDALEQDVRELKEIAERQQKLIELLIQSDELNIKAWIKAQHEKWVPRQCIDSQTLDLLEQRFKIYEAEGGNSWAERLVNEMRQLPVVTVVPIYNTQELPHIEE